MSAPQAAQSPPATTPAPTTAAPAPTTPAPAPTTPAPAPTTPAPAPTTPAPSVTPVANPKALLHATFQAAWSLDKQALKRFVVNEALADKFIAAASVERAKGVPVLEGVVRVELGDVGSWTAPACYPPITPKPYRSESIGFVMEYKAPNGCGAMWGTVSFYQNGDGAWTVNTLDIVKSYAVPPQK